MANPEVVIKARPEDWQVIEEGGACIQPGTHQRFFVEKTQLNTLDVVDALADRLGLDRVEVGYAGRKDKWGITQQWFSVPLHCEWPDIPGTRCLRKTTSQKKLRIGELSQNRFIITLRDVQALSLNDLLHLEQGFANKFGEQRTSEDNVNRAEAWLRERRSRKTSKRQQGWHLSVLRASLFNDVVAHRQAVLGLPTLVDGDVLVDGAPSGPLWGRGRSKAKGRAAELEQQALIDRSDICEALEFAGVVQARRPMYAWPKNFTVSQVDDEQTFQLEFSLAAGSYATAMLASVATVRDGSGPNDL